VREVLLWGTFSRYRKKELKNIFFVLFVGVVGVVPDSCGIHRPPGCHSDMPQAPYPHVDQSWPKVSDAYRSSKLQKS
jgi:hypothetical protein